MSGCYACNDGPLPPPANAPKGGPPSHAGRADPRGRRSNCRAAAPDGPQAGRPRPPARREARGGRGGYAQTARPPAGRSRAGRLGPRGRNTATTLRGRFAPPSTYAGKDLGAAAPEKRQGRAAPEGLGLAFLTGGASARTAAPQGPAAALSAGAGLRGRRTAAARRAAAEAATTAGAGRAAPRMVARATFFHLPRPAANKRGREGVPGAGCASGAGRPLLDAAFWQQGQKKRAALRFRGSLLFSR